jgi:hypothetical protein
MESLTKEYASPVCVCMQLRKAGRVVTQIYDRCLRPVGIRGTQFALLKRIACMRRPFITDIGKVLCMDQTTDPEYRAVGAGGVCCRWRAS